MAESIWQRENNSPGRLYMLGHQPHVKYDDQEEIIGRIQTEITKYLHIEPSIRMTLDGELTNAERAILAIPFETDNSQIINNLSVAIYHSLLGYYISADPKTSHFGISNLNIEGKFNSFLKRETEKILGQMQERSDMAGRLIQKTEVTGKKDVPEPGKIYLAETIRKGLDIHMGYRVFMAGPDINYKMIFIPLPAGKEIIERIYYNLEQILQHNFITYDETAQRYLKVSETLVFKELEQILKRAKTKELTRNKILNNLQFNAIQKQFADSAETKRIGDDLYDFLNNIQDTKLKEATENSRNLFTAYIKETTHTFIEFSDKKSLEADSEQELEWTDEPETPERPKMTREQYMSDRSLMGGLGRPASQPQRVASRRNPVRVTAQNNQSTQVPSPPDERLRVPEPGDKTASSDKEPVPSR